MVKAVAWNSGNLWRQIPKKTRQGRGKHSKFAASFSKWSTKKSTEVKENK